MTNLTTEIIASFNLPRRTQRTDWDHVSSYYTLPCDVEVKGTIVSFNEPRDEDSLKGLSGFLEINTKEELEYYVLCGYEELMDAVKRKNPEFPIQDYVENYFQQEKDENPFE